MAFRFKTNKPSYYIELMRNPEQRKDLIKKLMIDQIKGMKHLNLMDSNIQNEISRELYS